MTPTPPTTPTQSALTIIQAIPFPHKKSLNNQQQGYLVRLKGGATRIAALALAGIMLIHTPAVYAQPNEQPSPQAQQARPAAKHQIELVRVNFPGGTLEEYIDAIKKAMLPAAANIMIRGDVGDIPIDTIELEDVPLANAMSMLNGQYRVENSLYQIRVREYAIDKGRSAYTLETLRQGTYASQAGANQILVLSLKEITTTLPGDPPEAIIPAETVLTAIETALSVSDDQAAKPEVRYHAESGLLILSGPQQTLRTATDVIDVLTNNVRERRDRARDILGEQGLANPDALEEELSDAQVKAGMARVQLEETEKIYKIKFENSDEWEKLTDDQNAIENVHIQKVQNESDIEKLHIQYERAMQRVKKIEHALERSRQIVSGSTPDDEMNALRKENSMLRDRLAMLEAKLAKLSNMPESRGLQPKDNGDSR